MLLGTSVLGMNITDVLSFCSTEYLKFIFLAVNTGALSVAGVVSRVSTPKISLK